jgi:hypothetical protein
VRFRKNAENPDDAERTGGGAAGAAVGFGRKDEKPMVYS